MILGLDVSTSIIGWTVLDLKGNFIDIGHIDISKDNDFYIKSEKFKQFIKNNKYPIQHVYIEEPVKMFAFRQSMAQIIAKLQKFNAVCCYIVYELLNIKPISIMPSTARKTIGLKIPKTIKGKEMKEFILTYVKNFTKINNVCWEKKKTGTWQNWCFDRADSFVIALAGVLGEFGELEDKNPRRNTRKRRV